MLQILSNTETNIFYNIYRLCSHFNTILWLTPVVYSILTGVRQGYITNYVVLCSKLTDLWSSECERSKFLRNPEHQNSMDNLLFTLLQMQMITSHESMWVFQKAFLVWCTGNALASVSLARVFCYRVGYVSFSVLLLRYCNDNQVFGTVVIRHDSHSSSKATVEGPVEVT